MPMDRPCSELMEMAGPPPRTPRLKQSAVDLSLGGRGSWILSTHTQEADRSPFQSEMVCVWVSLFCCCLFVCLFQKESPHVGQPDLKFIT